MATKKPRPTHQAQNLAMGQAPNPTKEEEGTIQDEVNEANTRYAAADKYWQPFFGKAREELRFVAGDQWTQASKALREQEGRPCLTLNRVGSFLRNLSARNRQTTLSVQCVSDVGPLPPEGSQLNAVLRKIFKNSVLEDQLDTAGVYQIATGLGFLRICADYSGRASFDQDLKVEAVDDPSTVLMDPASKDPLFADARYCFIMTRMDKDEYLDTIGQESEIGRVASLTKFSAKLSPLILDQNTIVVAEYYRRVPIKLRLIKYANPETGEVKILDKKNKAEISALSPAFIQVNEKTVDSFEIQHSLFDGVEFHETTTLPGFDRIPVFPLLGERVVIDGKPEIFGAVRHSMDAQRLLNYSISIGLEVADLQTKSPWVAEDSALTGYEDVWRTANERNYSVLPYKKGANPPQRSSVTTDISALMGIKTEAGNDIQNIFGIFDLQQGAPSNETSGVAVVAKTNSANKSTFLFKDNLSKTVLAIGSALVKAIPTYYNGRPVQTSKKDLAASQSGSQSQSSGPDQAMAPAPQAKPGTVRVNIPDYYEPVLEIVEADGDETKKQQTNAMLVEVVRASPNLAPILADLIVQNSDIEDSEEVVARLQAMLPPQVQAALAQNQDASPEQLKGLVAGLQQQLQVGQGEMQKAQEGLQKAEQELAVQKADKDIEQARIELEAHKARMNYDIDQKKLLLEEAKLKVETALSYHSFQLQEEKMKLEQAGVQVDELHLDTNVGDLGD